MSKIPDCSNSGLGTFSLEVTARDDDAIAAAIDLLPPGTEVFIANLPGKDPADLVPAADRLRRAGLHPVPHLVARNLRSQLEFSALLSRLRAEAAPEKALLLGGDAAEPLGPFAEALDLMEGGLLQQAEITHIALAVFPEGHPHIDPPTLRAALRAKLKMAERIGMGTSLVSQFAFTAEPILRLVRDLRSEGIGAPMRVGVAGPASRRTLLKFGKELGAGRSLRVLGADGPADRDEQDPGALLDALARAGQSEPELAIIGAHFFAFGSAAQTIRWAQVYGSPGVNET